MYARLSGGQTKPGSLDSYVSKDVIKQWRETTVAQKKEGGKGGLLLVDRSTNKYMSVSLWETEDAMKASEAAHVQRSSPNPNKARPSITEHYEVVAQV